MTPRVLLCFHSRPMSLGIMLREAFRQAGCAITVAGPGTPEVYEHGLGGGDNFDDADYVPPDIELPNEGVDVQTLLGAFFQRTNLGPPDLIVFVDQADPFHLCGTVPEGQKIAIVQVEDWGEFYAARYAALNPASPELAQWYSMINHSMAIPLPREDWEWMPFGFDPQMHRYLPGVQRDKVVCQIGSAYTPRPQIWDYLRAQLDGATVLGDDAYRHQLQESPSTLFGRAPSHWAHVQAYNRAHVAISSSNCDFAPMRVAEAYGMGCVLVSDDVPALRKMFGPPSTEGGFWVAHDRSGESILAAIRTAAANYYDLIDRGMACVHRLHTYRNRAERILSRAGLRGACRIV